MRPISALALMYFVSACREQLPENQPARGARAPHVVERTGLAMGSELALTAWTSDDDKAESIFDAVFADFDKLDRLMSVWRPGSDILRLNAAAGDHAVAVSPEVFDALEIAHQ